MSRDVLIQHLRRYPRWYALLLVWALGMIGLPAVGITPISFHRPAPVEPAPSISTPSTAPGRDAVVSPTSPSLGPPAATAADDLDPVDQIPELIDPGGITPTPPGEDVAPSAFDPVFDLLPKPVAPTVPAFAQPVADAVAPVATYGCSGIGLAGVVLAVVAQSANGVPIQRLIPYLAPATTACAAFPIPAEHTECESDKPFIIDAGGLTKSPPILGLGIDEVAAMEHLLESTGASNIPHISDTLRATLDCQLVS